MFLSQLTDYEKETFMKLAYEIANQDGDFAEEEKMILSQYAQEMNMSFEADNYQDNICVIDLIDTFRQSDSSTVKKIFIELMGLVLVDNEYNQVEAEILEKYIEVHGLDSDHLVKVKNWVENMTSLYSELSELI